MMKKLKVFIKLSLKHILCPLHLYCRLIDLGISEKQSRKLCISYEIMFYSKLNWQGKKINAH